MKRTALALIAALLALVTATAQEIPQFTSDNYEGWSYNNPGIALSPSNIAGGKIALYVNQQHLALMLCSPVFPCGGIDSIATQIIWYTPYFNQPDFVLSYTALTLAIDDADGHPVDSVTCVPTTAGTSTHMLSFSVPVPARLDSIRMRFVSWRANSTSCGAIKRALFQAVTSTVEPPMSGDIDGDGRLSVGDVTALIAIVLGGGHNNAAADIDGNGRIDVTDVTLLIQMVLMI